MYIYLRKNFFSHSLAQISFFILSLLSLLTLGTVSFKYVILSMFCLSIFYIEFKNFNKFVAIINFIAILIILIFTKLTTMTIIFCFFLFYGFFKFKINLIDMQSFRFDKNKFYILIFIFFLISLYYNLKPQQENYFIYLNKVEVEKISNGKYKNIDVITNKYFAHSNEVFNEICITKNNKNKTVIKSECIDFLNTVIHNRISINNLDPNLFALILMFIVIFFSKSSLLKKIFFIFG